MCQQKPCSVCGCKEWHTWHVCVLSRVCMRVCVRACAYADVYVSRVSYVLYVILFLYIK
uniref:Restriction alleviation protein n=1 Tax=Siphoviridae sp. ctFgp7 TaxID=2827821 RepID=A0A8S5SST2_9CAUD|nr:MAG TPA: restriction alleviation protein [Siphoviridae sp. ctFgp7]